MIDPARFDNAGFAIVRDVIANNAAEALCEEIESLRSTSTSQSYAGLRNLLSRSKLVHELAAGQELRALVEPILGPAAFCKRALLFDKSPDANWWVGWHQDEFITVREKRDVPGFRGFWRKEGVLHAIPPHEVLTGMLTVRVHLDDSTADNGALQVVPGSHQWGKLDSEELSERCKDLEVVTCEVPRGGVLLMRPLLLHGSQKAERPARRRVIHLEYAASDLPGGLEWNERC
jgi:ectoine hydroxylase-related dioxygenase (phytanoyl-CoA dioxygenase family)